MLRNKLQWNWNQNSDIFIKENAFEYVVCDMAAILSQPQWVNSSSPSDAYMPQWTKPSLVSIIVVACLVPSHYLNKWWFIVNWTTGNKYQWNLSQNKTIFIRENAFENVVCMMLAISSQPQCANGPLTIHGCTTIWNDKFTCFCQVEMEIDWHVDWF